MADYIRQIGAIGKLRRLGDMLKKCGKRVVEIAEVATRICDTLKSAEFTVDTDNDCVVKINITIIGKHNDVQIER